MSITMADLEKKLQGGKIRGYSVKSTNVPKMNLKAKNVPKKCHSVKSEPIGLVHIKQILEKHSIFYETEYVFKKGRKFRFDIAVTQFKLYIEYDGIMSAKSRHTSITGFSKDLQKFNIATIEGWVGFRYSPLNYKDFDNDIVQFLLNN